jgi:hypothetical protein
VYFFDNPILFFLGNIFNDHIFEEIVFVFHLTTGTEMTQTLPPIPTNATTITTNTTTTTTNNNNNNNTIVATTQ